MANDIISTRLLFVSAVWLTFIAVLLRAIVRAQFSSKRSKQLLLNVFLCCLAFTFWGKDAEQSLDRYFDNLPLAVYIKYVCFISVAHLFYNLLKEVQARHVPTFLRWLAPISIIAGVVSFLSHAYYPVIASEELRFLVIGARDSVVLFYVLFSFIPGTLAMRRQEHVESMRFKLMAMVLCSIIFLMTAISSIVAAVMVLSQQGNPSAAAATVQPMIGIGLLLFMLIIMPHRWFMGLFQLPRLYLYYRLWQLDQRILRCKGLNPSEKFHFGLARQPQELEYAIYRVLISVLDFYPVLAQEPENYALYERVQTCIKNTSHYKDLVQELARL